MPPPDLCMWTGVRSLSVHANFGTKGWTISVQDDFGTYAIHMRSISVHAIFGIQLRYINSTILVHPYVHIGTFGDGDVSVVGSIAKQVNFNKHVTSDACRLTRH